MKKIRILAVFLAVAILLSMCSGMFSVGAALAETNLTIANNGSVLGFVATSAVIGSGGETIISATAGTTISISPVSVGNDSIRVAGAGGNAATILVAVSPTQVISSYTIISGGFVQAGKLTTTGAATGDIIGTFSILEFVDQINSATLNNLGSNYNIALQNGNDSASVELGVIGAAKNTVEIKLASAGAADIIAAEASKTLNFAVEIKKAGNSEVYAVIPCEVFFTYPGSESELMLTINYSEEELKVSGADSGGDDEIIYMYALKANDEKQKSEKWYPLYGYTLNISKYVPKRTGAKPYKIAVRKAAETADAEGKFATRSSIEIKARPDVKTLKGQVVYNPMTETFENKAAYDVEIFLGDSKNPIELTKTSGSETGNIKKIPMDLFPAGSAFTYRTIADNSGATEAEKNFASLAGKGKIAAQPKAPNVSLKTQKELTRGGVTTPQYEYIKGSKSTMEVYVGIKGESEIWVQIPAGKNNINLADLKALRAAELAKDPAITDGLGTVRDSATNAITHYILTFRTMSTTTKPASAKTEVKVESGVYKILPTAVFETKEITTATNFTVKLTLSNGTFVGGGIKKEDLTFNAALANTGITVDEITLNPANTELTITFKAVQQTTKVELQIKEITIAAGKVKDTENEVLTGVVKAVGSIKVAINPPAA